MTAKLKRKYPIGAEVQPKSGAQFRVWAPKSSAASVVFTSSPRSRRLTDVTLTREKNGYFSGFSAQARAGDLYRIKLDSGSYPDPASRFQPDGPHGFSQIVDPAAFKWTDQKWTGPKRGDQVIYEMHLGTFTQAGSWEAAAAEIPELARLGITMLEIMPIADFPGRFGWGYDGVNMFAPSRLYGSPEDARAFINQAHRHGLAVILDVVYNHFGPDGNYLREFSENYFSKKYKNEWGDPINFDDKESGPVREFFIANACYWIDEFHFDGLRLDATQQIFDASPEHILTAISRAARRAAGKRSIYLVAENETQVSALVKPAVEGGCGLDALWNDDFHHSARVALTGRQEAYYTDYNGSPQEFISACKWGYLFQGQRYKWQKQRRGIPALDLTPDQFVTFIENHDQAANSLSGKRLHQLTSPGGLKAMTALLLLGPGTPMLFQGQEFASSAPFYYFAEHHPELSRLVEAGRKEFLKQFPTVASPECEALHPPPGSEQTFLKSKLDLAERLTHESIYRLHRDLIQLRKADQTLRQARQTRRFDGAVLGPEAFLLRFFGAKNDDRLLLINFGRDLYLDPAPEPLLAPVGGTFWKTIWSSEDPQYGGWGTPALDTESNWRILGQAAVLMAPQKRREHGKIGPAH